LEKGPIMIGDKSNSDDMTNSNIFDDIQKIGSRPFSLRFKDRDFERDYIKHYDNTTLSTVRVSLILGLLIYSLFGFLDLYMAGEDLMVFLALRFGVAMLFNIIVIFLISFKKFRNIVQLLVSANVLVSALVIIAMIIISDPPTSDIYYVGLIQVILYSCTIIRLRHSYAMITSILIIISYEIGIILTGTTLDVIIPNNFFFLSSFFIGAFASYLIEFYSRSDFYLSRKLEDEYRKIELINSALFLSYSSSSIDLLISFVLLSILFSSSELINSIFLYSSSSFLER
jgi:hypothetical protein